MSVEPVPTIKDPDASVAFFDANNKLDAASNMTLPGLKDARDSRTSDDILI